MFSRIYGIIYRSYRCHVVLSILDDIMATNFFEVCSTEKSGHVIIIASYKDNNGVLSTPNLTPNRKVGGALAPWLPPPI